jgi:MFS family permease
MEHSQALDKPPTLLKWRALIGAILVHAVVTAINFYSNNNSYIAAYFKKQPQSTIVTLQIWQLFDTVGCVFGVKVAEKYGFKLTIFVLLAGFALLNLIASFFKSVYLFMFVYSTIAGLFTGAGYLISLYISWTYWPEKKSIVTGLVLFSFGIFPSLYAPISASVINPNKAEAGKPEYSERLPWLFQFYAIVYTVVGMLAWVIIPNPWTSQHYQEKEEARKVLKNLDHIDEHHQAAAHAVIYRDMHQAEYKGFKLSKEDIMEVIKHELLHEVQHVGDGFNAVLIDSLSWDRLQDMILQKMKYHKEEESVHHPMEVYNKKRRHLHAKSGSGKFSRKKHHKHSKAQLKLHSGAHEIDEHMNGTVSNPDITLMPPKRKVIVPDGEAIYKKLQEIRQTECSSLKQGVFSIGFLFIFLISLGVSAFIFFITSNWKSYYMKVFAQEGIKVSDGKLSLIITFGAIANALARILVGVLLMKINLKIVLIGICSVTALASFTFQSLLKNYGMGVLYIMVMYFVLGTTVTSLPTLSSKVFGANYGTKLYPVFFIAYRISSFGQYFLYAFYGKNDDSGMMFYLFGAMAVVALILSVFINLSPNWKLSLYPQTHHEHEHLDNHPMETDKNLVTKTEGPQPPTQRDPSVGITQRDPSVGISHNLPLESSKPETEKNQIDALPSDQQKKPENI